MGILEQKYAKELELLHKLFPYRSGNLPRLNEIYEICEERWDQNLKKLKGKEVEYLLIAEAPPWTAEPKDTRYFYFTFNKGVSWISSVWNAFYCGSNIRKCPSPPNITEALDGLADKGFVLIDSLPFAENYTKERTKKDKITGKSIIKKEYLNLVDSCSTTYFAEKVSLVRFSRDVKVALAFPYHSKALIESLNGILRINENLSVNLDERLIASQHADGTPGSGVPVRTRLKEIWGLSDI